jgi:hypothetical protein
MEKVRQRNWLLLITGVLLITTIIVLFLTTKRELGIGVCYHNGFRYEQNQLVPDYERGRDCYCSWDGEIVCEDVEISLSYDDFTSDGLTFSYSFRNLLEKTTPDLSKVTLADINYRGNLVDIIIEREVICQDGGQVPTQIGMYEQRPNSIVLTTITNMDETLYSRVCVIVNTFSLIDLDFSEKDQFSLIYQNEVGQLFDLNACFVNDRFYAPGDVFKDLERDRLCTCEGPELECEEL